MNNTKSTKGLNLSFAILTFLSFALLIFFPTIKAPFLLDDGVNIIYNNTIKNLSNFTSLAYSDYLGFLSLALNYKVGGLNPTGYHFVNITLHGLNGFLIWLIIRELFKSEKLIETNLNNTINANIVYRDFTSAIVALFFLVHPIQNAAVSYISQRPTVLCTFFYFLALLFYFYSKNLSNGEQKYFLLLSVLFTITAMFTNSIAFTLPIIIIVTDVLFYKSSKENILKLLPFAATLLLIPTVFLSFQSSSLISIHDYILTQFVAVTIYIKLVVLPFGFNADYDIALRTNFFIPSVIFSFAFLASIIGASFYMFRKYKQSSNGHLLLAFYGIIFFFTTIVIESSVFPNDVLIAEHRMYLPLFGLAITISFLILFTVEKFNKSKFSNFEVFFTSFGLLICLLIILSFYRAVLWSNPERIMLDTVSKSPNKSIVYVNLGLAQEYNGNLKYAVKSFRKSFKIDEENFHGYNNLARVFAQNNEFEEAIKLLDKSLSITDKEPATYNTLGVIYANLGDFESAVKFFNIALRLDDTNMTSLMNSGLGYAKLKDFELAKERFNKALSIEPHNKSVITALYNLSQ